MAKPPLKTCVHIPAYKGALTYTYAHETEEEAAP